MIVEILLGIAAVGIFIFNIRWVLNEVDGLQKLAGVPERSKGQDLRSCGLVPSQVQILPPASDEE